MFTLDNMGAFQADEVNEAFALFCPELKPHYSQYPMEHDRWLNFKEKIDGKPTFVSADTNEGFKEDYVWCKNGPVGRGYYHVLTKTAYVNLYSRLMMSEGGGAAGCGCTPKRKVLGTADQHDTARRIVYARSRCSRPNDFDAQEQQIDHMAGTKLNPVHGLAS